MRVLILVFSIVTFCISCTKEVETAGNNTPAAPVEATPVEQPKTSVTVTINGVPMTVTTLNFNRTTNSLSIEASNDLQKVTLSVTNFYQSNPYNYICNYEVTYFTRTTSTGDWIKYAVNRSTQGLYFSNFTPMKDKIVRGDFYVTYGNEKAGLEIKSKFKLVF